MSLTNPIILKKFKNQETEALANCLEKLQEQEKIWGIWFKSTTPTGFSWARQPSLGDWYQ